jgi:hypothetical protein
LRIPWWQDQANRLRLDIGRITARYEEATAEVSLSVQGRFCDDVGLWNRNPGAVNKHAHDGFAIHNGLEEIASRPAILLVAARLAIAILIASIVHAPIVHVGGCDYRAEKNADDGSRTLY